MSDFLRSIKLIRDFTITLNCSKSYFMKALAENTKPGSLMLRMFEILTSGPPFRGTVGIDQFKIRQRQMAASNRTYMVTVKGTVMERNDKTIITLEASGANWMLGFFGMMTVFLFAAAVMILVTSQNFPVFIFPVMLLQVSLILLIPYIMLRRALGNIQREYEKEFHFLVKDYQQ